MPNQPALTCQEFRLAHLEFSDGTLPAEAELAARWHLESCEECAGFDCLMRRGMLVVRNLPPVPLRADSHARILARIAQDSARRRRQRAMLLTCAASAASIGIVAAALTLGAARHRRPPAELTQQALVSHAPTRVFAIPRAPAIRRDFAFAIGNPALSFVAPLASPRNRFADAAAVPLFIASR